MSSSAHIMPQLNAIVSFSNNLGHDSSAPMGACEEKKATNPGNGHRNTNNSFGYGVGNNDGYGGSKNYGPLETFVL